MIYEKLGTNGLVLKAGKVVREIHREEYCASAFEYPALVTSLPDGTQVLIHCPKEYGRIEIEEIESGKSLTQRETKTQDFFHSRFQLSPNGNTFISAGWVWHPFNYIQIYDIASILESPELLDVRQDILEYEVDYLEINSVAFLDNDTLVLSRQDDNSNVKGISKYAVARKHVLSFHLIEDELEIGTLMAIGNNALSFYGHPKLINLNNGEILEEWPEVKSGVQESSIIHHHAPVPAIALDPNMRRFAIAEKEQIIVFSFQDDGSHSKV